MSIRTDLNEMLLRDIFEAYQRAEETMLERIAKRTKRGVTDTGWTEEKFNDVQKLRREVETILGDVNQLAKAKLSDGIIKAYKAGVASASKDMKKVESILNDFVPEHIQRMILETNNLIDNTSFQILRNTQDVYRSIISETSTQALLGVETRLETAQNALNMFAAKGITGFVDRAGRRWDLASYVEMATRTATARAALQGHIDRQIEIGNDLVMVSSIGTTCPICAQWQGKVLSISGKTPGYSSLDSAKAAGLFHPNCKHTITAYFPEIDDYEPPVTKNNPEKYEATQEQRYNERQIRKWKRVEAAAMTPAAKAKAANMVKKWQGIQRAHIAEWDLRRQYGRESIKNRVGDASKARVAAEKPVTILPQNKIESIETKPKDNLSFIDKGKLSDAPERAKKEIRKALEGANDNEKALFEKLYNNMGINFNDGYTAGFNPKTNGIYFNEKLLKDPEWFRCGFVHESLHAIDFNPNGDMFGKWKNMESKFGKAKNSILSARKDIKANESKILSELKKIKNPNANTLAHDFFDNIVAGEGKFKGHGIEYYKKAPIGTFASEALANYGALRINGYSDAVALIEKYHPSIKQTYEAYIEALVKEGAVNKWN